MYQPIVPEHGSASWVTSQTASDDLPTDERVKRVSAGADDLGLQELYFQFARYLLISSSRPDGLPANLQGIWAAGIDNPWGSKWTININTEMNYWLAEPAGLGETDAAADQPDRHGAHARERHRNAGCARLLWRARICDSSQHRPVGRRRTDRWLSVGHLADGRRLALAACVGSLRIHAGQRVSRAIAHGPFCTMLLSSFSIISSTTAQGIWSQGRRFRRRTAIACRMGADHSLTMGPTMDIEIVRELFTRTLDAGRILGEDAAFLKQVEDARQAASVCDRQARPTAGVAARL